MNRVITYGFALCDSFRIERVSLDTETSSEVAVLLIDQSNGMRWLLSADTASSLSEALADAVKPTPRTVPKRVRGAGATCAHTFDTSGYCRINTGVRRDAESGRLVKIIKRGDLRKGKKVVS